MRRPFHIAAYFRVDSLPFLKQRAVAVVSEALAGLGGFLERRRTKLELERVSVKFGVDPEFNRCDARRFAVLLADPVLPKANSPIFISTGFCYFCQRHRARLFIEKHVDLAGRASLAFGVGMRN